MPWKWVNIAVWTHKKLHGTLWGGPWGPVSTTWWWFSGRGYFGALVVSFGCPWSLLHWSPAWSHARSVCKDNVASERIWKTSSLVDCYLVHPGSTYPTQNHTLSQGLVCLWSYSRIYGDANHMRVHVQYNVNHEKARWGQTRPGLSWPCKSFAGKRHVLPYEILCMLLCVSLSCFTSSPARRGAWLWMGGCGCWFVDVGRVFECVPHCPHASPLLTLGKANTHWLYCFLLLGRGKLQTCKDLCITTINPYTNTMSNSTHMLVINGAFTLIPLCIHIIYKNGLFPYYTICSR